MSMDRANNEPTNTNSTQSERLQSERQQDERNFGEKNFKQNTASIIQRSQSNPNSINSHAVMQLQQAVGNRAAAQLLAGSTKTHNAGIEGVIQRVVKQVPDNSEHGHHWESDLTGKSYKTRREAREAEIEALQEAGKGEPETAEAEAATGAGTPTGAGSPTPTAAKKKRKPQREDTVEREDTAGKKDTVEEEEGGAVKKARTGKKEAAKREKKAKKERKEEAGGGPGGEGAGVGPGSVLGRPKRTKKVPASTLDKFIKGPRYRSGSHPRGGGVRSTATLGPNSYCGGGSDADSKKPGAIVPAREKYGIAFKAGHLLNAEFYGDGKDPKNLTILTPSANTSMNTFDNNIKRAVAVLKKLYDALSSEGVNIQDVKYGIEVVISVSDDKWDGEFPGNCIAESITCEAAIVGAIPADLTPDQHERVRGFVEAIEGFVETASQAGFINNKQPT